MADVTDSTGLVAGTATNANPNTVTTTNTTATNPSLIDKITASTKSAYNSVVTEIKSIAQSIEDAKDAAVAKLNQLSNQLMADKAKGDASDGFVTKLTKPLGFTIPAINFAGIGAMFSMPILPTTTKKTTVVPNGKTPDLNVVKQTPSASDLNKMNVSTTVPDTVVNPTIPATTTTTTPQLPPPNNVTALSTTPDPVTGQTPLQKQNVNPKAQIMIQGEPYRQTKVNEMITILNNALTDLSSYYTPLNSIVDEFKSLASRPNHPKTEDGWKAELDLINGYYNSMYTNYTDALYIWDELYLKCLDPNTAQTELADTTKSIDQQNYTINIVLKKESDLIFKYRGYCHKGFDWFQNNVANYLSHYTEKITAKAGIGAVPSYALWKLYDTKDDPTNFFKNLYVTCNSHYSASFDKTGYPQYSYTSSQLGGTLLNIEALNKILTEKLTASLPLKASA